MKCIRKAIEIEAIHYTGKNNAEVERFCGKVATYGTLDEKLKKAKGIPKEWYVIKTLEGDAKAYVGDYIIKGVNGEFYPCSESTFTQLYTKTKGNKYEKIPVYLDFIQYTGDNSTEIIAACWAKEVEAPAISGKDLLLRNGDNILIASPNDYVIFGVNGQPYPCKPDIFEKTYTLGDPDWVVSLREQEEAVSKNIEDLQALLLNKDLMEELVETDPTYGALMGGQLSAMQSYRTFLILRLNQYETLKYSAEAMKEEEENGSEEQ